VPVGSAALTVWPSPSRAGGTIQISMAGLPSPGSTPVDVSVYDVAGRRVAIAAYQVHDVLGGVTQIEWDGRGRDGLLKPGVYLIRARAPGTGWEGRARIVILE